VPVTLAYSTSDSVVTYTFYAVTSAVLRGGVAIVTGTTSLAAESLGMVETAKTLAGVLVTASRHRVVDVVVTHAAFTRTARHQRVAMVILSAPVTARPWTRISK